MGQQFPIAVLVLCFWVWVGTLHASSFTCREDEREVLLEFKSGLIDEYNRLASWTGKNCCKWDGVQCDNKTGNVVELHLAAWNFLGSASIPRSLVNLSALRFLDLSFNPFNSSIPTWLGNMRNLEHLNLSYNHFIHVEGGILGILGKLCRLKVLNLDGNQLKGDILGSTVNLSRCIRYDMEELYLRHNLITGHLPNWLGDFRSLRILFLGNNSFSGPIPISFRRLSSLEMLDLAHNYLYGVVNEAFFFNLSNLTFLNLGSNSLTLELASDWLPPFQLKYLGARSCRVNTSFPKWILLQRNITNIDLSNTSMFGTVPEDIGGMIPYLNYLFLADNLLSGSIPRSLCKLVLLGLNLRNNRFSGVIPKCPKASFLGYFYIDLSSNKLSGIIPNSLTNIPFLVILKLNNNSLEGDIPSSWKGATSLNTLDLGENNLSGNLSSWNYTDFPDLKILRLRDNRINGIIPPELCSLHNLQQLDLASNSITGVVPQCFGNFTAMIASTVQGELNEVVASFENIEAVIKGQLLEYTKTATYLMNMDLSNNNLVGTIPLELTNLAALTALNLSNNHLVGPIPANIGEMRKLESLDLSSNHLSGTIPQSMSALTFLAYLKLSHNNLHGSVPTGSQLQTLNDPTMYVGNPNLCGNPLPKKCSKAPSGTVIPQEEGRNNHEQMWFYIVIVLGVATGFWGVVGALILNKRWRYAYFQFAEDTADWVYVKTAINIVRLRRKPE